MGREARILIVEDDESIRRAAVFLGAQGYAVRAEADDYLVKPFSMAELLVRIHALLRRAGRLCSQVHTVRGAGYVLRA